MLKTGFLFIALAAALFFTTAPHSQHSPLAGWLCVALLAAGLALLGAGQLSLWRKILTHKPGGM